MEQLRARHPAAGSASAAYARSNITIDRLDNNDEFTGSSRTDLSLETVQEFQVANSGLSAESGGASGGAITVLTRNGANTIHGDALVFLENPSFCLLRPLPFRLHWLSPWTGHVGGRLHLQHEAQGVNASSSAQFTFLLRSSL
jgi:hypothetical protein